MNKKSDNKLLIFLIIIDILYSITLYLMYYFKLILFGKLIVALLGGFLLLFVGYAQIKSMNDLSKHIIKNNEVKK